MVYSIRRLRIRPHRFGMVERVLGSAESEAHRASCVDVLRALEGPL